jgi:hypothetical protein
VGTDIHCYVEKKVDGVWALVYPKLVEIRSEVYEELEDEGDLTERQKARRALYDRFPGVWVETYEEWKKVRGEYEEYSKNPFYLGRNYDLFAILADVRNGRGFAGCPTGGGFNPIAEPKGIPEDASGPYAWEAECSEGDGHSHSWFTVKELLAYNWDQSTTHEGWVSPRGYIQFKENGSPENWCGMVSGGGIQHVSNEDMEKHIADGVVTSFDKPDPFDLNAKIYTHVEWKVSYESCVSRFLKETIPALQQLGDPEEVRICFFFDN